MIEAAFSNLYALVPVISISAYAPQIMMLVKSHSPARDICLRSWFLWLVNGLIALGYGVFCLHDFKFCMVTALSTAPIAMVLLVVFYNRHIRPGTTSSGTINLHNT